MGNKFLTRPTNAVNKDQSGRFELYNLAENPFPSTAVVNKDSVEKKINGLIYEGEVRKTEYSKIVSNFLRVPQNDPSHLRLGFILDTSYIGRGNGKSTFIINILREINSNYCLDLSGGANKCFAVHFAPEGGGKTKTFEKFVDLVFEAIVNSGIINATLAALRLEVLVKGDPNFDASAHFKSDDELVESLNTSSWFDEIKIFRTDLNRSVQKLINDSGGSFEIPKSTVRNTEIMSAVPTEKDFLSHYYSMKNSKDRFDFLFNGLIDFFITAGFNGAYIFVDDFERIPDFQSAIQKKDFATQLRTVLYDGLYTNSRIGFYNFIFALHAGVPRLLQDAWSQSGLEHRVSMNPSFAAKHMISFDKLEEKQVVLLIQKYLNEYRINPVKETEVLAPFDAKAIYKMGKVSEMNASKILQLAHHIIDYAAEAKTPKIDSKFLDTYIQEKGIKIEAEKKDISSTQTVDLLKKATKKSKGSKK